MRNTTYILALLLLGVVLVSPTAWGCESSQMSECSLANCPMNAEQVSPNCQQMNGHSAGCGSREAISDACCGEPRGEPLAEQAVGQSSNSRVAPPIAAFGEIGLEPPPLLPADATKVICTKQHEVGRFTILSSYLL